MYSHIFATKFHNVVPLRDRLSWEIHGKNTVFVRGWALSNTSTYKRPSVVLKVLLSWSWLSLECQTLQASLSDAIGPFLLYCIRAAFDGELYIKVVLSLPNLARMVFWWHQFFCSSNTFITSCYFMHCWHLRKVWVWISTLPNQRKALLWIVTGNHQLHFPWNRQFSHVMQSCPDLSKTFFNSSLLSLLQIKVLFVTAKFPRRVQNNNRNSADRYIGPVDVKSVQSILTIESARFRCKKF